MLRTRLIVGSLLAALMLGALFIDNRLVPWFPVLFLLHLTLGVLGVIELLGLLPSARRPPLWLCLASVATIIVANWARPISAEFPRFFPVTDPWHLILGIVAATALAALLVEMARFDEPGEAVARVANAVFAVTYLGVLASFLAQLRWLPDSAGDARRATHALMLTVFVPKLGDVGAYCTGRLIGRHRMTPRLSPKKTWEGAAGGLAFAVVIALVGSSLGARPTMWVAKAIAFGILVGIAGMLGDLAESLIKREGQKKDASQAVPGFGGVLDVIDSLLFAAPVAYVMLTNTRWSPL